MAAALAVMPGRAERHGGDERAELEPGVEAGEQAEGHPGLGDRLPRATDLRDLDQVVHQREPREPRPVGREGDVPQPRGRVLAPREPGHLEHDLQSLGAATLAPGRAPCARSGAFSGARPGSGATWWTTSQPSVGELVGHAAHPLELTGQRWGGDRPVAARRCGAGTRRRGSRRRRPRPAGRHPRAAASQAVRRSASRPSVSTTVVRPRPSRAATTVSSRANASVEASRSCGPLPTTPRSASEETISSRR